MKRLRHQINQDMGPQGRVEGRESALMFVTSPARFTDGAGFDEGAQGPRVLDGTPSGDARLDAEHRQTGAVTEVEEHPRVAVAQVDPQDLRPVQAALPRC